MLNYALKGTFQQSLPYEWFSGLKDEKIKNSMKDPKQTQMMTCP